MYYCGLGIKRNYTKSFELLLKADTTQHYVQQVLGEHYYYGRGVEKDINRALIHFNNFINFTEEGFDGNDDIEIPRLLTKELDAALKIIKKHQK